MNELNNFFLGVQQVAQDAVDKAPYDRTFRGVIEEINGDGTCNVRINGRTYENIPLPTSLTDLIYPIGSIYMSINNTNPSVLFGGSWQQIKDKFLLSSGDTYVAGTTGGEAEHTLTIDEMPSHNHDIAVYQSGSTETANGLVRQANGQISTGLYVRYRGGNQPHNNMPPYLTVYMWQRIG